MLLDFLLLDNRVNSKKYSDIFSRNWGLLHEWSYCSHFAFLYPLSYSDLAVIDFVSQIWKKGRKRRHYRFVLACLGVSHEFRRCMNACPPLFNSLSPTLFHSFSKSHSKVFTWQLALVPVRNGSTANAATAYKPRQFFKTWHWKGCCQTINTCSLIARYCCYDGALYEAWRCRYIFQAISGWISPNEKERICLLHVTVKRWNKTAQPDYVELKPGGHEFWNIPLLCKVEEFGKLWFKDILCT